MIKGCSKRVVVMRDIESDVFEEAFFIVRPGSGKGSAYEDGHFEEAKRIMKDGDNLKPLNAKVFVNKTVSQKSKPSNIMRDIILFFSGFGIGTLLFSFVYNL